MPNAKQYSASRADSDGFILFMNRVYLPDARQYNQVDLLAQIVVFYS